MKPWRLALLVVLGSARAPARTPWTLEDLQALATRKAWAELLEHAEDIAPSARAEAWRTLVTDAAVAQVGADTSDGLEPFAATRRARTLAQRHAFLVQAPRFTAARDAGALKDLGRCLDLGRPECLDTYLELTPGLGSAAALEAAHLVRRTSFSYGAMPLFAAAVGDRKDAQACADAALAETVVAALGLPTSDPRAISAKTLAFGACWSALRPKLQAATVGASSYFLANTCQPMRARKALSELQQGLCEDEGL